MLRSRVRHGYPTLPSGFRVYAVGDIHGRLDLLDGILWKIDQDRLIRPVEQPIEVFLGDYIDRGPDSKGVIDRLVQRRAKHTLICLCGNHEYLLLGSLNDPSQVHRWLINGGGEALRSYGIDLPSYADPDMLPGAAMREFAEVLPESHRNFFEGLPLTFTCGDYLLVHAGIHPGMPLSEQSQEDLLWIRWPFLMASEPFEKLVVHGHTPVREPELCHNRINIDTGAYATDRLTCLVIDDDGIRFL